MKRNEFSNSFVYFFTFFIKSGNKIGEDYKVFNEFCIIIMGSTQEKELFFLR